MPLTGTWPSSDDAGIETERVSIMPTKTEERERTKPDSSLESQLKGLTIWPKLKKRLGSDPDFSDAIASAYTALKEVVDYRRDSNLTVSCKREPYSWALLFVVDCRCSHEESLKLWSDLSENLVRHWRYPPTKQSDYLRLVRIEVRSIEDREWEAATS